MSRHVIVGAGPVGATTALALAEAGHDVRVVTRSGGGPRHDGIELVAADATDTEALTRLAAGAAALYNCANPPYHRWLAEWPPLWHGLTGAAERTGAVLVSMSNLYGYGPIDHPMRETDPFLATTVKGPVRAGQWTDALARYEAGRLRATEARASDFFGPRVRNSHLGERFVPPVLAGRTSRVIGDPDQPHSWTYMPDVARALVVLGTDERAWGRPWHVPTAPPITQREALTRIAERAGAPSPKLAPTPGWVLRALGLVSPEMREIRELTYQFERPFVVDSSAFTATFGVEPTPLATSLAATADWWTSEERAAA
jgi:nucleoside-diphosphate-sugar epimerase